MSVKRGVLVAALAAALALALAPAARADVTIAVTTLDDPGAGECEVENGKCSLREALELAAAGEEPGVSGVVTIKVEGEGEINTSEHGELKVEAGSGVESVAVEGPGARVEGPPETGLTIDAGGASRVFYVGETSAKISGLTIAGGQVDVGEGGAGLYSDLGSVVLENAEVVGNEVSGEGVKGGGIRIVEAAQLEVVGSRIGENRSEDGGGGVSLENASPVTITRSEIDHNTAVTGAGLAAEPFSAGSAELTIVESSISWNEATGDGGGLSVSVAGALEKSTVNNNTAEGDSGGGVQLAGVPGGPSEQEFKIATSTIADNEGGGIVAAGEVVPLIEGSTIVGNTTETTPGAGIEGAGLPVFEGFEVRSSILAANKRGEEESDCHGEVESGGGNIVGEPAEAEGCEWEAGKGDAFETDPELRPLEQNGGPTFTMMPETRHSPVINKGAENGDGTDQRGLTRPVPKGRYDVGAVEVQAPVDVEPPFIEAPGEPEVGDELSCEQGEWDTDSIDPEVEFIWKVGEETLATGAEGIYELTSSDAGRQIECEVEMDNGATAVTARTEPFELPPPIAELSASELDLGERRVDTGAGNEKTLTVTNGSEDGVDLEISAVTSSDSEQFPLEAPECEEAPIAPEASCEVKVSFDPTAAGEQSAELVVESNGTDARAQLTGTGTEPEFSAEPESFDFGDRPIGTGPSAAQSFTVTDAGTASMEIGEVKLTGEDASQFQLSEDGCSGTTLQPEGECRLKVAFAPTATGKQSATIEVPGQAPGSIPLEGTGTEAKFEASPTEHDFGAVRVGSGPSAPQSFTITDAGTASMEIGEVKLTGKDPSQFQLSEDGCSETTLEAGGECQLVATFVPTATGARSATIEVPGQAPGSIPLEGTGTEARIAVVPPEADFGAQQVGSPPGAPQTFTVTSTGTAPLQIGTASIAGPGAASFAIAAGGDRCSGRTIALGASCAIAVTFSPRAAGALAATLALPGNAPASVPLAGTGTEPPPTPPPPPPPPPPPAEPPPAEPPPSALLLPHRGSYMVRGGKRIRVRLRCSSGGAACRTQLKLVRGGRLVGRWQGRLAPGESRAVTILLSRRGRRQLAPPRRLRASLRIVTSGRRTAVVGIAYRPPGRSAERRGHGRVPPRQPLPQGGAGRAPPAAAPVID